MSPTLERTAPLGSSPFKPCIERITVLARSLYLLVTKIVQFVRDILLDIGRILHIIPQRNSTQASAESSMIPQTPPNQNALASNLALSPQSQQAAQTPPLDQAPAQSSIPSPLPPKAEQPLNPEEKPLSRRVLNASNSQNLSTKRVEPQTPTAKKTEDIQILSEKGIEKRLHRWVNGNVVEQKLTRESMRLLNLNFLPPTRRPRQKPEDPLKGHVFETEHEAGISYAQGLRGEMEDAHLTTKFHVKILNQIYSVNLFGIFDGHNGGEAAKYVAAHLQSVFCEKLQEAHSHKTDTTDQNERFTEIVWNSLKQTFVQLHKDVLKEEGKSGTTATVSIILNGQLWVANVGDSRTIITDSDQVVQLSEDAKPVNERFKKSIIKRGGNLFGGCLTSHDWSHFLSVARAIGDKLYGLVINPRPKITRTRIEDLGAEKFLILACDGIWDVLSTNSVAQLIKENQANSTPEQLAKLIVERAYELGSKDNLSAIVYKIPDQGWLEDVD